MQRQTQRHVLNSHVNVSAIGFAALGIMMGFVFSNIGGTVLQVHNLVLSSN